MLEQQETATHTVGIMASNLMAATLVAAPTQLGSGMQMGFGMSVEQAARKAWELWQAVMAAQPVTQ